MNGSNSKLNFRYKCQINEVNYSIQLFNIQQEKIKIMIATKNAYSDDYTEYSNIYTLIQFQEITKYFLLFETIEEIFDDLSRNIQEKNFSLSHNGNTMTLTLRIIINQKEKDVNFILDKNKIIDLSSSPKDNLNFYNNNTITSSRNYKQLSLEKSKRNIDISSINDLNNLLNDFKYRISVLETKQNNPDSNTNIENNKDNNINMYGINGDINAGLENLLIRLNNLEKENDQKNKKIEILEKKLKYYESFDKNNINNNNEKYNNNNIINSIPTYPNNYSPKNNLYTESQYNNNYDYKFQEQRQLSLTYNKNMNYNKYNNNNNEIYIKDNNKNNNINDKNYRLKQSKSEFFNKNSNYYNNNENMSLYSKETKKSNLRNTNSYNSKKISFKENNQTYPEKSTYRSNKIDNSIGNDVNSNLNSSISNISNSNNKNFKKYTDYKEKLGIPIVPRENLKKYINSRIIFTKNELRILKMKLSGGNKRIHVFFDLLYRASTDGDYEEIIEENIINKGKTLTLFYTYEGSRFGVYIHQELSTSFLKGKIFKEVPGSSFIVSLNNLRFFDISPNKTSKEGIEDYLSFGRTYYLNSNGSNWLIFTPKRNFLKKRCILGNQQGDYYDYDPEILVGKKFEYHIKDVEIFEVAIEKE